MTFPYLIVIVSFLIFGAGMAVGYFILYRQEYILNKSDGTFRVIAITSQGGRYIRVTVYKENEEETE